ncbi:MAG: DUF3450 family protein [Desulfurivibrio sp.]|nr:DUF3450 family protein [Desulfurivibrio sp.]
MKERQIGRRLIALAFTAAIIIPCQLNAQTLDDVLGVRAETTQEGRRSQIKIDEIQDETRDLLSQYKRVMKIVDGLRVYNRQQERLIARPGNRDLRPQQVDRRSDRH